MIINPLLIEEAKKTIDKGENSFKLNTLVFFVSKESEYVYEVGSMPSYFNYEVNGIEERYVLYKKPNISHQEE